MNIAQHLTYTAASGPLMTGYRGKPTQTPAFLDAAGEFRAGDTGRVEPGGVPGPVDRKNDNTVWS